jgi:hypothetical protein
MTTIFRKSRRLKQRNYIHIYSNGHTEINYFQLKKDELGIRNVTIEPIFENSGNPKKMQKKIANKYNLNDIREDDKIFCVIDVDENSDKIIQEALQTKESKFIQLILSNPNFEIWFLLHFKHYTSQISMEESYTKLKEHLPEYSKPKVEPIFLKLKENEKSAIINAKKLRKNYLKLKMDINSRDANPYTSVDIVVDLLNSLN